MKRLLLVVAIVGAILALIVPTTIIVGYYFETNTSGKTVEDLNWEPSDSTLPDIYIIVEDGYPGKTILESFTGFNNSEFYNSLKDLGFYVREDSYSNYPKTTLTFMSMLNMEYLVPDAEGRVYEESNKWVSSLVVDKFELLGYKTIDVGAGWAGTWPVTNCDVTLRCPGIVPFRWDDVFNRRPYLDRVDYQKWSYFQMEELSKIPDLKVPTFSFVHAVGGHSPTVFSNAGTTEERLVEHLQVINEILLKSLRTIVEKSEIPPIIIVMSDHGLAFIERNNEIETIKAGLNNFEAYYLPGLTDEEVSSFGSLVSTFPLLLNYYFGFDYEILPERNYWLAEGEDWWHDPYVLIDVTEEIANEE